MKQRYYVIFRTTGNQPKYFITRNILVKDELLVFNMTQAWDKENT